MYPFDFIKSKNYWQVLGFPPVDKNNRVSNDMSMRQIKSQFAWKLDYAKERLEKLNKGVASAKIEANSDFAKAVEASLISILDVINAYLILFYFINIIAF